MSTVIILYVTIRLADIILLRLSMLLPLLVYSILCVYKGIVAGCLLAGAVCTTRCWSEVACYHGITLPEMLACHLLSSALANVVHRGLKMPFGCLSCLSGEVHGFKSRNVFA